MGQTKNRSGEKSHKKDQQDSYNCYKFRLRAIKKLSTFDRFDAEKVLSMRASNKKSDFWTLNV